MDVCWIVCCIIYIFNGNAPKTMQALQKIFKYVTIAHFNVTTD